MLPVLLPVDLGERLIPYEEGWDLQRRLHTQVVAGESPPTILLLEHADVYTAGSRTEAADLPGPDAHLVAVDRGGRITWHGPGQLIAYPVVPLQSPVDVVDFVRRLEDAIMRTCADVGLATVRVPGRSGVWVDDLPERKVAAIGVRVARGVTMHGVALNVDCDLTAFDAIVPCGIPDAGVTSLAEEGIDVPAGVTGMAEVLGSHLRSTLAWS